MDLNAWLDKTELVVCVGAGGVGKTTTAATIALRAAQRGRRAMVLTIDPAKRLANSLGLDTMGGEPTRIDGGTFIQGEGELWAAMLDSRSTFDALITEVAPTEEAAERVLSNHVYRHMADTFAGSQDYMATEKLHDLVASGRFDLIVLDTPPVKNALDFLEAPGRVVGFLDEKVLGWLLTTEDQGSVWGRRLLGGASSLVFRLMGMVFGAAFLDDLRVFLHDFRDLYDGFRTRHKSVLELFRASTTQFLTVAAPTESSLDVAAFFQEELARRGLQRAGVVINQVVHMPEVDPVAVALARKRVAGLTDDPDQADRVVDWMAEAQERLHEVAVAQHRRVAPLIDAVPTGAFFVEVPRLRGEVHDLAALSRVGEALFDHGGPQV